MPSKKKEMLYSWEFVVEANHRGIIRDLDLALLAAFEESEEAYNICVTSARANAAVKRGPIVCNTCLTKVIST